VISLGDSRRELVEWQAFAGKKAEIQVRTVLQHAWAAIDHKLRYKREREVPRELRRGLFRLSALLEVADKEFSRLRDQADAIRAGYESAVEAGALDVELVADSLDTYLLQEDRGEAWLDRAIGAGFVPHTDQGEEDTKSPRMRSAVLSISEALGLSTLEELDGRIRTAIAAGAIEEMVELGTRDDVLGDTTVLDLVANLLLFRAPDTPELRQVLFDDLPWVDDAKAWFESHLAPVVAPDERS
jgi:hypothetical protein